MHYNFSKRLIITGIMLEAPVLLHIYFPINTQVNRSKQLTVTNLLKRHEMEGWGGDLTPLTW